MLKKDVSKQQKRTEKDLYVSDHASADETAWSISCCSQDTHIQMGAFLWCLMTSQLVEQYQKPVWHPDRIRRGRRQSSLCTRIYCMSVNGFVFFVKLWLTWSPLKTLCVCMWYWALTSTGGEGGVKSLSKLFVCPELNESQIMNRFRRWKTALLRWYSKQEILERSAFKLKSALKTHTGCKQSGLVWRTFFW